MFLQYEQPRSMGTFSGVVGTMMPQDIFIECVIHVYVYYEYFRYPSIYSLYKTGEPWFIKKVMIHI